MRVGFGGILFIVFLVLKLTGTIAWSWWWVTSPLWIPLIVVLVSFIMIGYMTNLNTKKESEINKRK